MDPEVVFIGGMAYTEDKILVHNIKVLVAPVNVTIKQVTKYFKKFGKVNKVRVIEDSDQRMPLELITELRKLFDDSKIIKMDIIKEYIIEYPSPRAAFRALRKNVQRLRNQVFYVSACHSFEQPNGQKMIEQLTKYFDTNIAETNNNCSNQVSILSLNDDCLEIICKLLPVPDQVNFALSCTRFSSILSLISKVQLKNLDIDSLKELTLFQIRIFLQIVGPQIKTLTLDMSDEGFVYTAERHIFSFLGMFLVNVQKVKVRENTSNITLCSLVKNMHSLQELELVRPTFSDEFIKSLEAFKNLRSLVIKFNDNITGSDIAKLTGLEKLVLNYCPNILYNFKNICKSLTNLNYLDIKGDSYERLLDAEDYEHILKYLVKLRTLKIFCKGGNYNCLAELPNLKVLEIRFMDFADPRDFLIKLAEHKANQLEELNIRSSIFGVDNAFSVSRLQNLKVLICNMDLDDDTVEQFFKLKELENIELYETADLTGDVILNLLKSCLKLKRVCMWCLMVERADLLSKARKLLKEQRDHGERNHCVQFVFRRPIFEMSFPSFPPEQFDLSDVLKVTEEPDFNEDEDDNYFDFGHDNEFEDGDDLDDLDDDYGFPYDSSDGDFYDFLYHGGDYDSDEDDDDDFFF